MYIPGRQTLSPAFFLKKRTRDWEEFFPFNAESKTFFSNARSAIFFLLKNLNFSASQVALLPSYLCTSVALPFQKAGVRIKFYRVNNLLEIDLDDFLTKINEQARLALIIHYFGFPQPIEEIRKICQTKGVFLLEDCAQALFSRNGDEPLGSFGDAGVFSLRKTLPLPDGGLLIWRGNAFKEVLLAKASKFSSFLGFLKEMTNFIEIKLGFSLRPLLLRSDKIRLFYQEAEDKKWRDNLQAISRISQILISRFDFSEIIERRIANFQFYLSEIGRVRNAQPIFWELPRGVCPFGFPILVKNRDKVRIEMLRRGINLRTFWDVLPGIIPRDEFLNSYYLSRYILVLPTHQDIMEKQREKILAELESLSRKGLF